MPTALSHPKSSLLVPILVCLSAVISVASAQTRPPAAPETPGANLPAQPIGANDLVAVSVYDAPELTRTVRVSTDGFIRLQRFHRRVVHQSRHAGL